MGRPCRDVFRSNICKDACALRYTMDTGKPVVNLPIHIRDATGTVVPVTVSTALLRDREGNVIGGVETYRRPFIAICIPAYLDVRSRHFVGTQIHRVANFVIDNRVCRLLERCCRATEHDLLHSQRDDPHRGWSRANQIGTSRQFLQHRRYPLQSSENRSRPRMP